MGVEMSSLRGIKKKFAYVVLGGLLALLPGVVSAQTTDAEAQDREQRRQRFEEKLKKMTPEEREVYNQLSLLSYVTERVQRESVVEHSYRDLVNAALDAIVKKANKDNSDDKKPKFIFMNQGGIESEQKLDLRQQFIKNMQLAEHILDMAMEHATEKITVTELVEAGLKAMLQSMDPHSGYLNPKEWKMYMEQSQGSFFGIGAELEMQGKFAKIRKVMEGQPAEGAGMKDGDLITAVDGKPAESFNKDLMKIVQAIRGEKGTPVTLEVQRAGQDKLLSFTIIRGFVETNPVKTRLIEAGEKRIGLIHLTNFTNNAYKSFVDGIQKLKIEAENAPDYYILDLRNDPGGNLEEARKIADAMLDEGEIYSLTVRGNKKFKPQYATKGDILEGRPLVVLVNRHSISASEVLSGTLKDNGRAIMLNPDDATFGKGSGQKLIDLREFGGMRITTFYYNNPKGTPHTVGIKPDIKVELSEAARPKLIIPPDTSPEDAEKMKKDFEKFMTGSEASQKNHLPVQQELLRHDPDPAQSCAVVMEDKPDVHYTTPLKDVKTARHGSDPDKSIIDETLVCAVEKLLGISERATFKPYVKQEQDGPGYDVILAP